MLKYYFSHDAKTTFSSLDEKGSDDSDYFYDSDNEKIGEEKNEKKGRKEKKKVSLHSPKKIQISFCTVCHLLTFQLVKNAHAYAFHVFDSQPYIIFSKILVIASLYILCFHPLFYRNEYCPHHWQWRWQ